MAQRHQWIRCPVCGSRLHTRTSESTSGELTWRVFRPALRAWLTQHAHAARDERYQHALELWLLGYRTEEPRPYEVIDDEED